MLLAFKIGEEGPEPRNTGSLWEAGKARRLILPENLQKRTPLSDTVILTQ